MALYETMNQLGLPTYMRPILQEDFTRRGPGREKAVTGRRLLATTKSHSINEEYQVDSDGKEIQQVRGFALQAIAHNGSPAISPKVKLICAALCIV